MTIAADRARAKYAKAHPERVRAAKAAWRVANPDKVRSIGRAWSEANREKLRAQKRARYAANADRERELEAARRARNPAQSRARSARWSKANPDKTRAASARHRARRRGVRVERYEPVDIFERDAWVCQLCLEPIDPALAFPAPLSATIDHTDPDGADAPDNVVAAHNRCNTRKRDGTLAEYLERWPRAV